MLSAVAAVSAGHNAHDNGDCRARESHRVKLQLASRVRGRRVSAELDLRTLTATFTIARPRRPAGAAQIRRAPPPSSAPPEQPHHQSRQSTPAPLPQSQNPPVSPPSSAPPELPHPQPPLTLPTVGPAPVVERVLADARAARPRRHAVVWGGGALAAVALASLGMLLASRLDSTEASSSAKGPPPPTTRETGPRPGIGGAVSSGAIAPPPPARARTTTRVRTTAPAGLPPEVPFTSPARTTPTSPTAAALTMLHWPPSAGAAVYWFELYRVGSLGARKILEARPEQAQFAIPRRAPDGTALGAGLYNWTASPQRTPNARVHYTAETRAGRFRITSDGRIVLRPR